MLFPMVSLNPISLPVANELDRGCSVLLARIVKLLRSESPVCCLAMAGKPELRDAIEQAEQLLGIEVTAQKPRKRRKS